MAPDTMQIEQLTSADAAAESPFALENSYTLEVDIDGSLLAKAGSMVAYTGDLSFTGQATPEGGITGFIKEAATGEGTPIMTVEGTGTLYLADAEKKIQLLGLESGESITVNGEDLLAFEPRIDYEISTIDSLAGAFAGGFTNVYLEGPGAVAITTHGEPVVFEAPVATDPSATVAWSRTSPNIEVNKNLSDLVGQESGERFQMDFRGSEGYVIVQPYEEL